MQPLMSTILNRKRRSKMRADLPVFLSDRDPLAVLDRHADTVLSAMREWGIGRIDERETVHFCGLINHPEDGAVVFLPRESGTGDPVIDLETASLTMRALARFGVEASKRDYEDDGEAGNPGCLSVIRRLADDFRDHGLFAERTRQRTINSGKPDWMRTVKREVPMPGHKGQPIFTDIRSSRSTKSSDALLSQIQAAVIREIYVTHSWWLTGTFSRREELLSCQRPPFPRTTWVRKLEALLTSLYSARSIFLAEYLRYYLRETRASASGSFVFGVEGFHTVWETILRETIKRSPYDTMRNWNSELPKPFYLHQGSFTQDPRSRGMQTDIILEHESSFTIVDAKYYAAKNAGTAPGWPDIAKQIFYEKALREIVDNNSELPAVIHNIFAFPAATNDGPLKKAEIRHTNGKPVSSAFPPIVCSYVSVREALKHYASRSKGIDLENDNPAAALKG